MARALRIRYPNAVYHVTCRGNDRKDIFKDERDRLKVLEKLQNSLTIYGVILHAYVLMKNHFHLIVETPKANLSEFMRHFNVSYTMFFNNRHHRVGHLYQGRFKAILVEADSYLLELSRYVHLNPIRVRSQKGAGFQEKRKYLERYPWSSLRGYLHKKRKENWIEYRGVLDYVQGSRQRYGRYIEEGMREGYSTPWENLKGQVVLGGEVFFEEVKDRRVHGFESKREQPSLRVFQDVGFNKILTWVAEYFNIETKELKKKRSGYRNERAMGMELLYRYCGMSQGKIGEIVGGLDYTAVSRERKMFRERIDRDPKMKKVFTEIETRLKRNKIVRI